jgi:2-iminobutanoate/2-iminopropanoate deaminase
MKALIFTLTIIVLTTSCRNSDNYEKADYIETEEFSKLNFPFSQAVQYGNIIYVSGQVGDLEETGELVKGGIIPETNQAMKNIQKVLEQNGSSMDKVIKCTCMLDDISEWGLMSAEYIKFFPNHKPARSAFATRGLALGARVEIECMAYVK